MLYEIEHINDYIKPRMNVEFFVNIPLLPHNFLMLQSPRHFS